MLAIRFTKRADGGSVLSCTRADGSVTWQKQQGRNATFFPVHDLTHYAVESTLGHTRGFYGLLEEGWDIADFGTPWPRGPMPDETVVSELVVGFLDAERAGGVEWCANDLNEKVVLYREEHGGTFPWTPLTDDDLARVRAAAADLIARWAMLDPGASMQLHFDAGWRGEREQAHN
jgi:hypothetical protein